jgi:hypothetical protein
LSRQEAENIAVEYKLLATNATAKPAVTTVRGVEAFSHRGELRFGADNATAPKSAATTTKSGR